MKKCTEITELLSAYSDNELTDKDKLSVEEHLAACENCSALLEIYREISISVDESGAPVPDALRIGVMNRIRSENIPAEKEIKKKKWWQHQVILTRLAPIAACLVVVLLVWQFSGNMFSLNEAAPMAAPMMDTMPSVADSAPAPADAPAAAEFDYVWNEDDGMAEESEVIMPAEAAGGVDSYEYESQADVQSTPEIPPGNRMIDDEDVDDIALKIQDLISHAYAEITITGELPAFLADYEPLPLEDLDGWDMIFEVPSTEVDALMLELINRSGISLTRNHHNQDSTYAIVLYSSGR